MGRRCALGQLHTFPPSVKSPQTVVNGSGRTIGAFDYAHNWGGGGGRAPAATSLTIIPCALSFSQSLPQPLA